MERHIDAIVVGAGLGGLTAGALYARSGRRVLVLERNATFGGAATVYRHGPLAIEASLHEIDGLDADDPKLPLLRSLGLDRDLTFVDVGDLYEVRGPQIGAPFVLPHGVERAIAATVTRFPEHTEAIEKYFRRLVVLRQGAAFAARHMDDTGWWLSHIPEAVRALWPILREGRATVSEVLDDLFGGDESIKLVLAANLAYYDADPDRMRFLYYAVPQASYLMGGGHYVRGGSQALSDRLVAIIREAGGMVESGRDVNRLLFDGDRVAGVGHHARRGGDARVDYAPVVFGNAAPQRLAEMMPDDKRPAFLAQYARERPSISLWTISIGLERPAAQFGVQRYSTFVLPAWLKTLRQFRETSAILGEDPGTRTPSYVFVDYSCIDSGLNSTAPFLCSFCGFDRMENWTGLSSEVKRARRERWMDRIIGDLDREFPGIAGAVVQREMATAETMHDYLNTPDGAVYGFAPDASRGLQDMTPRTAIGGLWLASAYTSGGGFTGAMLGGAAAARAAMKATR